jgi:hypothetical protein
VIESDCSVLPLQSETSESVRIYVDSESMNRFSWPAALARWKQQSHKYAMLAEDYPAVMKSRCHENDMIEATMPTV